MSATASNLTTADPVRLAEQRTTLSLLSRGRTELVAGQGGLPRDLELFGVDPHLREEIFEERLDQLLGLLRPGPSDLLGTFRERATNVELPATGRDPRDLVWAASSGSPRSVLRGGTRARCDAERHGGRVAPSGPLCEGVSRGVARVRG
ncbi:LLM class flavin-dependent oxidoreductase [Kocuria carniphila]|uniref:LLM class flavin-dependent oxidoreductase n=1 Tax=Kocuria carniphila TaxID=262208 RepID=UPI0034CDB2E5